MSNFTRFGLRVDNEALDLAGIEIEHTPNGQVRIGSEFEAPCSLKTSIREILSFGAFSYVTGRGRLSNVSIGRYCSIAEGVSIGYPEHPTNWLGTTSLLYMRPPWALKAGHWKVVKHNPYRDTVIDNDVWIGAHAFIRAGVSIGTGAIVGAHSVVIKDVPPYTIVAGNPARPIRSRFDSKTARELLALRWWEYSPSQLDNCPFDQPDKAIVFINTLRRSGVQPYYPVKLVIKQSGAELIHPNEKAD